MSVWIDRKYLGMVSSRLERFKERRTDLYNFRCPYCGDSQKKKTKARGYVYRKGNDLFFKCHNCGFGTTLARFLKHLDGTLFDQYCFERWKSGDDGNANYPKPDIKKKFRLTKKPICLIKGLFHVLPIPMLPNISALYLFL